MKINKQSNLYTVIYIIVLVAVVGTALAFTAMSLRGRQQVNADADKMKQILASIHVSAMPGQDVTQLYNAFITGSEVVNVKGEQVADAPAAFDVDIASQSKEPAEKRLLPVYFAKTDDGATKYILPVSGNGLWGPIWGYIALDADASTVYGAYFAHQGETPGLGAEIEKPEFRDRFDGKELFKNNIFLPIAVVKPGMKPLNGEDYVDGVSGGTITSKGVGAMIDNCLAPYQAWLLEVRKDMAQPK